MLDVVVIIVTWNVRALVLDALKSLYADLAQSGLNAHVIVVDSASSDGTVDAVRQAYPQTQVIASATNLGFAGGNNAALRALGFHDEPSQNAPQEKNNDTLPRAVYLLNPDTITQIGATRSLYDALMSDPQIGLVGARLTYGDGSFQHGAFAFPGLRQLWVEFFPAPGRFIESEFNGRYPRHRFHEQAPPFAVDFTLGATMMLRREVIQATGLFDESYFMYAEEVDWAWRIRRAGWQAMCVPQAHVVHLGGQSTKQVKARSIINLWQSRKKLYRRYYPTWKYHMARWLVQTGMTRKIRQARADATLSDADKRAAIEAYQTVREMYQTP